MLLIYLPQTDINIDRFSLTVSPLVKDIISVSVTKSVFLAILMT